MGEPAASVDPSTIAEPCEAAYAMNQPPTRVSNLLQSARRENSASFYSENTMIDDPDHALDLLEVTAHAM
jgi:hypothetical protein